MGSDDERLIREGLEAAERIEERSHRVIEGGEAGQQRWAWVRYAVAILVVMSIFTMIFVLRATGASEDAEKAAVDARRAAVTADRSEEQRVARSLRADCKDEHKIAAEVARTRFDKYLGDYLTLVPISPTAAQWVIRDLEVATANLVLIKEGELCSKAEFGVID